MKKIVFITQLILMLLISACGANAPVDPATIDINNIKGNVDVQTTAALLNNPDVYILDVREQWEYDAGHIPGINHIPMGEIPNRISEIPTDKLVIVTCRSGNRSGQITSFLLESGLTNVHNMSGGIVAWQRAGLEVEK